MELTHLTIVVLASMIFVLSGMVGYLYWQQTRILQHIQSLALAVANHLPAPTETSEEVVDEDYEEEQPQTLTQEVEVEEEDGDDSPATQQEDDRVSVEHVTEGPTPSPEEETAKEPDADDVDDLEGRTKAALQKLLTDKGIPYGKSDKKSILIQLLKASS